MRQRQERRLRRVRKVRAPSTLKVGNSSRGSRKTYRARRNLDRTLILASSNYDVSRSMNNCVTLESHTGFIGGFTLYFHIIYAPISHSISLAGVFLAALPFLRSSSSPLLETSYRLAVQPSAVAAFAPTFYSSSALQAPLSSSKKPPYSRITDFGHLPIADHFPSGSEL